MGVVTTFAAAWFASGLGVESPIGVTSDPGSRPLAAPPVVRWAVHLPGAVPNVATPTEPGGPAVSGREIFVGYSGASALYVLDRRDGQVLQTIATRASVATTPVLLSADRVLVSDSAGYTSTWQRKDGVWARQWEHYSGAPVVNTPTVVDGVVYLANVDELVFALDLASGELKWRYQHKLDVARSASLELFGAPAPQVAPSVVYCGFSDGFLVALDRAAGTELWKSQVGEGTYPDLIAPAVPLADGAVLVAGYTRPTEHFLPETRSPSWRIDAGSAAAPRIVGDTLYHPGSDGKLRQIDTRTGAVGWTWDSGTTGPLLTPELTPQGVLVASTDSTVFLLDPATGKERWRLDPGVLLTGFSAPPAVVGEDVYAVSNGGYLYALRGRAAPSAPGVADWVTPGR